MAPGSRIDALGRLGDGRLGDDPPQRYEADEAALLELDEIETDPLLLEGLDDDEVVGDGDDEGVALTPALAHVLEGEATEEAAEAEADADPEEETEAVAVVAGDGEVEEISLEEVEEPDEDDDEEE